MPITFATAADALAYFSAAQAATPPAPVAGEDVQAPVAAATEPAEPVKPGALARLFGGGQLAEAQQQLAALTAQHTALAAEAEQLRAANATLLEAANLAAARLGSMPQQVAAQVADVAAGLGVPAAALPPVESAPAAAAKPNVLAEYEAIKDDTARRAFFKANKHAILEAQAVSSGSAAE